MKEIYISTDIEATGPIPGEYSMYELGASVVGKDSEAFFTEINLLNDNFIPEALSSCGRSLEQLKNRPDALEPKIAMVNFEEWIGRVSRSERPVFVAFNATFDWMFVHWYFHKFLQHSPFGISGLDIKAYYMGMTNCRWGDTTKRNIPQRFRSHRPHTHNATDDATEQAEVFKKMLDYNAVR